MNGFSIQMMEEIMEETYEDEQFYFECIHFDSLEQQVQLGNAWAAIGGIAIDNRRVEEGF